MSATKKAVRLRAVADVATLVDMVLRRIQEHGEQKLVAVERTLAAVELDGPVAFSCCGAACRIMLMRRLSLSGSVRGRGSGRPESPLADQMKPLVAASRRRVERLLRAHPLWPFLADKPGLRGSLCGIVIVAIGNPHRFPGQRCSEGHYLPVVPGRDPWTSCPYILDADALPESDEKPGVEARCPGVALPPRPGNGVRSVWHFLGLHAVDGRSPSRRRGQRCDWHPEARAALLAEDTGLAAQILMKNCQPYKTIYDSTRQRLEQRDELKPFQRDRIARKVAVKAFVGDLLTAWKQLSPPVAA